MRAARTVIASIVAGALIFAGTRAHGQYSPNGWIRSYAWNVLFPLTHDKGCSAGGPDALELDWLCPHQIEVEDPRAGDVWPDIDLGGCSQALDLPTGGLFPAPTWINPEAFGLPDGDVVNFEQFVLTINAQFLDPLQALPVDGTLAAATTYIRNLTGAPLELELCTASDDSLKVWVNDVPVIAVRACRGVDQDCAETAPIVLPPGVSKIAALVWQGVGGWGVRVSLMRDHVHLVDGNQFVEFLGTGQEEPQVTGQRQFWIERTGSPPLSGCGAEEVAVALTGTSSPGFTGQEADPLTIAEDIVAPDPSGIQISGLTQGGVVTNKSSAGFTDKGFIQTWLLLGPFSRTGGPAPGEEAIRLDYLTDGAGMAEGTMAPRAGDTVQPDYGDAAASTGLAYSSSTVNPGGVPTWKAHLDLDDTIWFSDHYAGDIDDVMMYAVTYLRLDQPTPVNLAIASDDSIQVQVDGVEVLLVNAGRGIGPANSIQDVAPLGTLSAGVHRILVKVFDGVLGHGFRLRLQNPSTQSPLTTGLGVCLDPTQNPCSSTFAIGKTLTWIVTRAQTRSGLGYTISYAGQGIALFSGRTTGGFKTTGLQGFPFKPAPQGPVGAFEESQDVGIPRLPGSTSFDATTGVYTMSGTGADIWNAGDEFQFAWRQVAGDFRATARITELQIDSTGERWGKVGLMARHSCEPGSKYSFAQVPYRGQDLENNFLRRHQSRATVLHYDTGRDQQAVPAGALSHPYLGWVRLTRLGRYFYSEFADDMGGQPGPWVLAGGDTHQAPPEPLLVGFACCSNEAQGPALLTVKFDHFAIEPFTTPAFQCTGVGPPAIDEGFDQGLPALSRVLVSGSFAPEVFEGRLRLAVHGAPWVAGAIYFRVDGLALGDAGFLATFDVYIQKDVPEPPADGLTFSVFEGSFDSSEDVIGKEGVSLGYETHDINTVFTAKLKSFALEVDTWMNGIFQNDPWRNGSPSGPPGSYHIGLDFHQTVQSAQTNVELGAMVPAMYNDPQGLHVEVVYAVASSSTSHLKAWVTPGNGSGSRRQVLSAIGPKLDGDVFLGFTASTGALSSTMEVDNLRVSPLTGAPTPDCNANGASDLCDLLSGTSQDCNFNSVPDSCDIASGTAQDCNANGIPDSCEIQNGVERDCNQNSVPDSCDLATGALDCNLNSIPDACDIAQRNSTDVNSDGVPDDCQLDIVVVPVPVTIDPATTTGTRTAQPQPAVAVIRGATYWTEIWASDVGSTNTGLTGVYVDVAFCGQTTATAVAHGNTFTQFPSGAIQAGKVDELGGSALPHGGGITPQWVRVGWVAMKANADTGGCQISLQPAATRIAAFQRGLIHDRFITYGSAAIAIGAPSLDYDLDGDGFTGVGDLSIFAGSWLQGVPPADADHDLDCDDFVGVGDLSWFATAWLKAIGDPAILYPPCALTGGTGGGGGGTDDVVLQLTALTAPSASDAAASPPASLPSVPLGGTYYLELWASDSGDINTGLTSAYVDLGFPSDKTSVQSVMSSAAFGVFPSGTVQEGAVDELGGSNLEGKGKEPGWARVAILEMRADAETAAAALTLSPSSSGVAAYGRGVIPWSDIALPTLVIGLGASSESFRRSDANADRRVDLSDAVFTLNWLFTGGDAPVCPDAADSNDDARVDLSDAIFTLGWLFTGGQAPRAPGTTACGPDPTADALATCSYPAERC